MNVAVLSLRQRRTDRAQLGLVVAISMSVNLAGLPLGSAAAGPLVEASLTLAIAVAAAWHVAGAVAGLRL